MATDLSQNGYGLQPKGCNDIVGMFFPHLGLWRLGTAQHLNCDACLGSRLNFAVLRDCLINQVVDLVVWAYALNVIVVKQGDIRAVVVIHALNSKWGRSLPSTSLSSSL